MLAVTNASGAAGIVSWPRVGVLHARTTASDKRLTGCSAVRGPDRPDPEDEDDIAQFCKLNRSNPWTSSADTTGPGACLQALSTRVLADSQSPLVQAVVSWHRSLAHIRPCLQARGGPVRKPLQIN
jgi:hypothetical protein